MTAMEANEFPKLIPITVGSFEGPVGSSSTKIFGVDIMKVL